MRESGLCAAPTANSSMGQMVRTRGSENARNRFRSVLLQVASQGWRLHEAKALHGDIRHQLFGRWSSKNQIIAGQQASTLRWWKEKRNKFHLFISKIVWTEASKGNAEAVQRRLKFIRSLPKLQINSRVARLARLLIAEKTVPPNAQDDATHIALGAVHGMEFLLTWNFTHINNPATEEQIRLVCHRHGSHCPVICSPDQLLSL